MARLDDLQKRQLFRLLATKSQYQAGVEFELDKYFKTSVGLMNFVNGVYREVKANPVKFGVAEEVVQLVEDGMLARQTAKPGALLIQNHEKVDEKELVVGAKKKAWFLLNKKLDHLISNRKAFKNETILNLAKIAGISFDKSQIVRGEATEHIAMQSKIDPNITAQAAIEQLMRLREAQHRDDE